MTTRPKTSRKILVTSALPYANGSIHLGHLVEPQRLEQRAVQGGQPRCDIVGCERIGNYAVALEFSDGHRTGIFSWSYLRDLADRAPA